MHQKTRYKGLQRTEKPQETLQDLARQRERRKIYLRRPFFFPISESLGRRASDEALTKGVIYRAGAVSRVATRSRPYSFPFAK